MQVHFQSQCGLYKVPKINTINSVNNAFSNRNSVSFSQDSFAKKSSHVLFGEKSTETSNPKLVEDRIVFPDGQEFSIIAVKTRNVMEDGYRAIMHFNESHKTDDIVCLKNYMDEAVNNISTDLKIRGSVLNQVLDKNGCIVGLSALYPYTSDRFDNLLAEKGYGDFIEDKAPEATLTAELRDFCVTGQKDIAGPLLAYAEQQLKDLGYAAIVLCSQANNQDAVTVYSKLGFEKLETPQGQAEVFFKPLL